MTRYVCNKVILTLADADRVWKIQPPCGAKAAEFKSREAMLLVQCVVRACSQVCLIRSGLH